MSLEKNEMIAKYMNIPMLSDSKGIMWDFQLTGKEIYSIRSNELGYERSYDWLMPVVEKINSGPSAYDCIVIERDAVFCHQHGQPPKHFWNENHGGMKGAIYAAVCEYIENLKP